VANHLEDRGSELVAVDRLHQVHLETSRPHLRVPRAGRHQRDGRYAATELDVQVLELRDELAPRRLGRCEVAHDDVGDERGPQGVGGPGGGDDRARELEHGSKKVAGELVIVT
jgi:hypothetical protein